MTQHHDSLAADVLEVVGNAAGGIASIFGTPGEATGLAVKAITHVAAEAIRLRGVTTDEIVAELRKIQPAQKPWERVGKDPT